jgi:alpha-tubulin suppressor-like RCC1 family protein
MFTSWVAGKYCAWVVGPLTGKHLVAISGGTNHTLGLDKDGQVWAWGSNESGATGLGGIEGWVSQWTSGSIKPTKLSIPGRVVKISAGDFFNAVLDSEGNAYVWGNNSHGQLGLGHTNTVPTPTKLPGKYRDVVAGTAHILAVPK